MNWNDKTATGAQITGTCPQCHGSGQLQPQHWSRTIICRKCSGLGYVLSLPFSA